MEKEDEPVRSETTANVGGSGSEVRSSAVEETTAERIVTGAALEVATLADAANARTVVTCEREEVMKRMSLVLKANGKGGGRTVGVSRAGSTGDTAEVGAGLSLDGADTSGRVDTVSLDAVAAKTVSGGDKRSVGALSLVCMVWT
jgi:hypothetical protein